MTPHPPLGTAKAPGQQIGGRESGCGHMLRHPGLVAPDQAGAGPPEAEEEEKQRKKNELRESEFQRMLSNYVVKIYDATDEATRSE